MKNLIFRFTVLMFRFAIWLLRHVQPRSYLISANRIERMWTWTDSPWEYRLTARNTSQADGYSREELVAMQNTVWKHEDLQNWKVPAPYPTQRRGDS